MNLNQLIPKDKSDLLPAYRLEDYKYEEIKSIVPQLMEWLQDMNWPVAGILAENLLRYQDDIEDEIMLVLNTNDEVWKYWVISIFGKSTKSKKIQERINQIATHPTLSEVTNEVNLMAIEVIKFAKWS
ncbi:DUF5071 domain-containing protein [Chryseobacterium wangxinyae]|uniref:DUF5071 domain-containing protein n=1 Tax=Chryseobacterium sp. CY353 TaxID=2997334 RepID=UPI00226FEBB8|nr:DUF5071 domain-containing protein [Chryseobacterium sp. CY353]MCY0968550.1 DUF5071 domain-containing protein [Chryseobacterium sp. CY353]